jgi:hypothetical protein
MFRGMVFSAVLACLLGGCGGSDNNSPTAKCNSLVNLVCQRAIACANDGTTQSECVTAAMTNLNCADADDVSASYNMCISDLHAVSCTDLLANDTINLPATCMGVILFRVASTP